MKRILISLLCCASLVLSAQNKATNAQKDSTQTQKSKYEDLLKVASVQKGLFTVLQKGGDYYFEIPDSLLSRQYMIVNKISQVPMQVNEAGVNKGMNFENKIITLEKDTLSKKIWIKTSDPVVFSPSGDAITLSVKDNFAPSMMEYFDIYDYNKDKSATVVKVNKVFDGKEKSFNDVLVHTGLGGSVKTSLSLIRSVKGFQKNIMVRSDLTTTVNEGAGNVPITIGVTTNWVLLPKQIMRPRLEDPRVGYFTQKRWFFSDEQHALERQKIITRWRLEPKDPQKYLQGILVEPKKPIVFYIDPATPKKWRKFIIQGIHDWNAAFERAGFKNAIQAKDPQENNQDIDLDDVQYSGVTYVASPKANAMGPSVIDPRSGEIIEADVVWWHNVMTSLQNWMRIQTGMINPQVRHNQISDEMMGESIRFVSSHEIGHTLGLKHNMGASHAFAVDSLRSATFVKKNGISPSIMDYARYNYVAQPQDNMPVVNPIIGEYDKYAIEWGYRWFPNETDERPILRDFVQQHANNPLYFYGQQQDFKNVIDPRSQSEDLGDNSVKASRYGLENLKKITDSILNWTYQKGEDYSRAGKLFNQVLNQWQTYNYHVLSNIGGIYRNNTVQGENARAYTPVEKNRQVQAVQYLNENVFTLPQWLFFNQDLIKVTFPVKDTPLGDYQTSPYTLAREYQYTILYEVLSDARLLRLEESQFIATEQDVFGAEDLLKMLRQHIFAQTLKGKNLSVLERMTQKNYVDALIVSTQKIFEKTAKKNLQPQQIESFCHVTQAEQEHSLNPVNFTSFSRVSQVASVKRQELKRILKMVRKKSGDSLTKAHYQDLTLRIEQALSK